MRFSRWSRACDIVFKRNNSDSGKLFLKDGTLISFLFFLFGGGAWKGRGRFRNVRWERQSGALLRRSKDLFSYSIHNSMRTEISLCLNTKSTLPLLFSVKNKTKHEFSPVVQMFIWLPLSTTPCRNNKVIGCLLFLFSKSYSYIWLRSIKAKYSRLMKNSASWHRKELASTYIVLSTYQLLC